MKKIIAIILSIVMVAACGIALTACNNNDIIVQTNPFFAPFEYMDGNNIVGVDIDIMNKVGEKLNKKVKFQNVEFGVIIDAVSEGKSCDAGAAGITITEARAAKVDFSIPYFKSIQYVIYNDDSGVSLDNNGNILWSELEGKKIGVQANTTGDLYVSDEISGGVLKDKGSSISQLTNALVAVNAMKAKNVDVVVIDKLPAEAIQKSDSALKIAALYYNATDATEEEYAICVTKGNKELLEAINEVLTDLMKKGADGKSELEKMIIRHLGV